MKKKIQLNVSLKGRIEMFFIVLKLSKIGGLRFWWPEIRRSIKEIFVPTKSEVLFG